jgi:hypothetical protein
MKNNQAVTLSTLAATGSPLDLVLAEVQGAAKITRLATKQAPKSGAGQRNRRATGDGVQSNGVAVGKGRNGNLNPVGGQGKEMVANLDRVVSTYKRVKAAEHRADARAEAAARRAEREANTYADLDTLLDEVRG